MEREANTPSMDKWLTERNNIRNILSKKGMSMTQIRPIMIRELHKFITMGENYQSYVYSNDD